MVKWQKDYSLYMLLHVMYKACSNQAMLRIRSVTCAAEIPDPVNNKLNGFLAIFGKTYYNCPGISCLGTFMFKLYTEV